MDTKDMNRLDETVGEQDDLFVLTPEERSLVICRPFAPDKATDASPFSYYFVDLEHLEPSIIRSVADNYTQVLIEAEVAERLAAEDKGVLPQNAHIIEKFVKNNPKASRPKVVLLASNDTHAHFMMQIAKRFDNVLFVMPKLRCKDEGASERLIEHGIEYIEIDYADRESNEIERFRPTVVLCGADWTSEFIAVHSIAKRLSVPTVALQEGPQDWRMVVKGRNPNKYLNAEVLFSQGAVTLKYIRPKYFAVTGNPKTDLIEEIPLPPRPRVFINCNFTYNQYEDFRQSWMEDVLSICGELGMDYIISKHPRDRSVWDDPNLINSSAFSVKEQLISCSIVVSRFSNIPYEALAVGRPAVYYNPHGERMCTFSDDKSGGVLNVFNRDELKAILENHNKRMKFDKGSSLEYMARHCGPMDGNSLERIVRMMNAISGLQVAKGDVIAAEGRKLTGSGGGVLFSVIICTYNRANILDRVLKSVLKNPREKIPYEILVVDNASTDGSRDVVGVYLKDGVVRYVFEPELGLSNARNTGWQNAKGKYIVFLDDDGEVSEDWLEAFLEVFAKHSDAVACGGRIIPKYEIPKPAWVTGISKRHSQGYHLSDDVRTCEWIPGGNSVWKRNIINSLGGFDPRLGRKGSRPLRGSEESEIVKRALDRGYGVYYTPNAKMYHHISKERISLSYMGWLHLGHGITGFRWREVQKSWTRVMAVKECLYCLQMMSRITLGIIKLIVLRRKNEACTRFLEFMQFTGSFVEAVQFILKGKL